MIYVYTEDSGSGVFIWQQILKSLRCSGSVNFGISGTVGNSKLAAVVRCLSQIPAPRGFPTLTAHDTLIIPYDNYDPTFLNRINESLVEVVSMCGCAAYISTYACMEETFLRFSRLWDWIPQRKDPILYDALSAIISPPPGTRWWFPNILECDKAVQEFCSMAHNYQDTNFSTAEKAAASLLSLLTYGTSFDIQKHKLGPCWLEDCCWGQSKHDNFVPKCDQVLLTDYETADSRWVCFIAESGINSQFVDTQGNATELLDILLGDSSSSVPSEAIMLAGSSTPTKIDRSGASRTIKFTGTAFSKMASPAVGLPDSIPSDTVAPDTAAPDTAAPDSTPSDTVLPDTDQVGAAH